MAGRRYNSLKFTYTDDFGFDTLKIQRQKKDDNGNADVPLTSLFQNRVLNTNEKAEVNFNGQSLRGVIAYIRLDGNVRERKQFIPYNPVTDFDTIKLMIKDILELSPVICGDYEGEESGFQPNLNRV
jgi:hypothetical protein